MYKIIIFLLSFSILNGCVFNGITGIFSSSSNNSKNKSAPTLNDLFNGDAYFPNIHEVGSEEVELQFSNNNIPVYDQKLAIFNNPNDKTFPYYTLARGDLTASFDIFILKSRDGVNFNQDQVALFSNLESKYTFYDPHLSVDKTTSPSRYYLSMECACLSPSSCSSTDVTNNGLGFFGASVCVSSTTTPWIATSWSTPKVIVQSNGLKSASTGVLLIDQGSVYAKWTIVDDGLYYNSNYDEGIESTSTWGTQLNINNIFSYLGTSTSSGVLLFGAEPNPFCNSSWECNNIDIQDWKKIGEYYYAVYNGGNYYRCERPSSQNTLTSDWSLAIRRSKTPLGNYHESTGAIISSERKDTCGISYPTVNILDNETYLYYAYYPSSGGNKTMRSKLTWGKRESAKISILPVLPDFSGNLFVKKSFSAQTVFSGHSLSFGNYQLSMQNDGNLVLYDTFSHPLWNVGISGKDCTFGQCKLVFQTDGNLVLYDKNGVFYWQSGTGGNSNINRLILSNRTPYLTLADEFENIFWISP